MSVPTLVQFKAQGSGQITSMTVAPTVGNTLLLWITERDWTTGQPSAPAGFTSVAQVEITEPSWDRGGRMCYRVVQVGDTNGPWISGGSAETLHMMEWTGVIDAPFVAAEVTATTNMDCGGSLTPTAGVAAVIVGGACIGQNDSEFDGNPDPVTPDAGVTELYDSWTGFSPLAWVGYKNVAVTAGSYVVGGTIDLAVPYCGVTVALTGLTPDPPAAAFSGTPLYGTGTLAVTFTDSSSGPPASWLWDFGDGSTSTAQHPGHTYLAPGSYTVRLTVTNVSGTDSETKVGYISVNSAPRGISGAPEYVVELFDSGATFGPNNKIAEIWDALTVGWSKFDRIPGKAFFSLPQSSESLPLIDELLTHIAIWRITPTADQLVYRGAAIDTNRTGDDVIVNAFDYISLLSLSRCGFKTLYPTKMLGSEIVAPEWTLARGAVSSPLGFVTTGAIEDPLGTDEATAIKTNTQFGTLDQTRLQLFYDLTEMGRANTTHQVTFEIDLNNVFHFRKNDTGTASIAFVLGGNISDYQYLPGWARYRNDIATIGVGGSGGAAEITSVNSGEITAKGLRQDVTTLKTLIGIAGAATEADQQKAALDRALKNLYQQQAALSLKVERGMVEPFVGWSMNYLVPVEISNGDDLITGTRRIVGIRGIYSEIGEELDVIVAPVAS